MSADKARDAVIVDAGGAKLTGKTLEGWLLQLPAIPTESRAAFSMSAWTDAALLAKAMQGATSHGRFRERRCGHPAGRAARGASLEFWQARAAKRPPVTDAQADSLADDDKVRVFQHLVLRGPKTMDTAAFNTLRTRSRALVQRAQGGTDFAALVKEASMDSSTRLTGGFLPASTRDQIPPQLASILWSLKGGEISPSIMGPYGMEIFRRATRAESRPGLRTWLGPQLGRMADSVFVDSMMRARPYTLGSSALARVRDAAKEPVMSPQAPDSQPIATWSGGALSPATLRMWLVMLSPGERSGINSGSDTTVAGYIKGLVQREMVVAVAAPGGVPTPRGRQMLGPDYRRSLDSAKSLLRRTSGTLPPADAANAFIDSLLAGRVAYRPLPGMLSGVLRSRYPVTYDYNALKSLIAHVSIEWKVKHASDSTARPGVAKAPKDSGTP